MEVIASSDVEIAVANGDFEDDDNEGSTASSSLLGLIGTGTNDEEIGTGPWRATTKAILGFVAPPNVSIDSNGDSGGYCEVSGLALLSVGPGKFLRNSAEVQQELESGYESYTTYRLSVNISAASLLSIEFLNQQGIGIELLSNGTPIATSGADGVFLSLSVLDVNKYRLTVTYHILENVPGGNIGIRLFAGRSSGLVSAGVLPTVRFSNIRLTANYLES